DRPGSRVSGSSCRPVYRNARDEAASRLTIDCAPGEPSRDSKPRASAAHSRGKESDVTAYDQWFTGCLIAVVTSSFACDKPPPLRAPQAAVERDDSEVPENDYFYLQRISHDGKLDGKVDVQVRARAILHARTLKARITATSSLDAAGEWVLRGPLNVG